MTQPDSAEITGSDTTQDAARVVHGERRIGGRLLIRRADGREPNWLHTWQIVVAD